MLDLAAITADTFAPHVGSNFTVVVEEQTFLLNLKSLDLNGEPPPPNHPFLKRQPFSMLFESVDDGGLYFPQGYYTVSHEALEEVQLFMVPLGPGLEGAMLYGVVFS